MKKHIAALVFIFVCTSLAWIVLGGATLERTNAQDMKQRNAVGQLWGKAQYQSAPVIYYITKEQKQVTTYYEGKKSVEMKVDTTIHALNLESSKIDVVLDLEHRKKGLLWYSTYGVQYASEYRVINDWSEPREINFEYVFPLYDGIYDNFSFTVNGEKVKEIKPADGKILKVLDFKPGETKTISISYDSRGIDEWWYTFGGGVSHIRNFTLNMKTNFASIDFPENGISPSAKERSGAGWNLTWQYADLISGIQIGMTMPQKINPGPFVSRVTFFAPVSLFLFFFLMFIITTLQERKIHPMNFFFVSAAFFSFHLLLAYLADHVDIHAALAISSIVSIFLVVSYMRLVAGNKFAFLEIGISQFVYLVLFSYTFFISGYTGLAITILCILTLFVVMQLTGKVDWSKQFTVNTSR